MTDNGHSVSDTEQTVAEIEMLYQQRMTVKIPVNAIPASPDIAFRVVKNTDPEFIADALPSSWHDAMTTGHLDVVDIEEGDCDEVR